MPKSPEHMTADERLKRIRSLERKVSDLERDKDWAERERASTHRWAEQAWEEVRHLRDMCTLHWNEKQEIRRAAGLEPEPTYVPLAKFNHGTREWEPIDADTPAPGAESPAASTVTDLMAALEESVTRAKATRDARALFPDGDVDA